MHSTPTPRTRRPRRHIAAAAAAVLGCAALLSACGSSGSKGESSAGGADPGVRFAACMRSHGVPNFPDPNGGGIRIPNGVNPQAPAFQNAQKACAKLLPGGGPPRQGSESRKLEMLRISRCMRTHGVPSFPDPVATPPAPRPGLGLAFGAPGAFLVIPQALMQSPAFAQAAAQCGIPGGGRGPGKTASAG